MDMELAYFIAFVVALFVVVWVGNEFDGRAKGLE